MSAVTQRGLKVSMVEMGWGKRNTEGEMLLEFAMPVELIVCNTFYTKDESKKITYESGDSKSEIDYILVRRKERSVVKDVTTISGEACATQHKLLLCKIELSQSVPKKKKERPIDRCRLWKL